jgi:NhaA family Na+:H+ antiporter
VNDLLMALFFLLVGLEIAREMSIGEYRDRRAVTAPALAALGGLVLPAALFFAVVGISGEAARGWGIAISTDTAFALGVLALVGSRCPNRLRMFLLALAIVDDIAAIGVIAVFYTDDLQVLPLALAGVLLVAVAAARRIGLQNPAPYVVLALALWLATYASAVHPTVAGVGLGLLSAAYPPREDAGADAGAGSAVPDRPLPRTGPRGGAHADWVAVGQRAADAAAAPRRELCGRAAVRARQRGRRARPGRPGRRGEQQAGVGHRAGPGRRQAARRRRRHLAGAAAPGDDVRRWSAVGSAERHRRSGRDRLHHRAVRDLAFEDAALQQQAKIGILVGSGLAALLALGIFRFLSARGGLCLPEDAALSLPPLHEIPDPE